MPAPPDASGPLPRRPTHVTQFAGVLTDLIARYRMLVTGVESITMVYDAGQNSRNNHEVVDDAGIGFVASLPPSDHPDLLALPRSRYSAINEEKYPGLTYLDTTVSALGITRRAVMTHSPTLHAAQSPAFDQTLAKATARLDELAERLARGRTRRPRAAVEAGIAAITKARWVGEVLTTDGRFG